ncbi:MAG: hypothetical protein NC300_12885 [Bacteroidales bacterium]|nr:N-acetyltransferase [Roseburia sp.]MCM1205031.1 hypothetical protein [Bacteroidales bacterium]
MQNTKYIQFNLSNLIQQRGEVYVKSLLSSFSCPLNPDVEDFLKNKAIFFSQRGFAKTHLVFWSSQDYSEMEFVGYYSLAQKSFTISKKSVSNKIYGHLKQYGTYDSALQKYVISSILIGQLGKNFTDGNDTLISGAELLQLAINKVKDIQYESGGRYTYLECEDFPYLREFYKKNGFTEFGKRQLDSDETNIKGKYLIQYLKKL